MKARFALLRPSIWHVRGAVLPASLLLVWVWLSHHGVTGRYVFVPVSDILAGAAATMRSGELPESIIASLARAGAGLFTGTVSGVALGCLLGLSRSAERLIGPVFSAVRQVPVIGLVPLVSLWFGNGESAKLLVVSLAAFYPMAIASHGGVRQTDPRYLAVAEIYGVSGWPRLRDVVLPSAMPDIFTGFMQAVVFVWISTIGAELLFSPAAGLGAMMANAQAAFHTNIVLFCVLVIGVLGYLIDALVVLIARLTLKWRNVL